MSPLKFRFLSCSLGLLAAVGSAAAQGTVSENLRMESEALGYALQYRVYTPPGYDDVDDLPSMYLADGQWYLDQGGYAAVLDKLITEGDLRPTVAVFIDNRNPDNLEQNRRNSQFFCNPAFESFVADELVAEVDRRYKTSAHREDRAIMGLSFGGLVAACFALHENDQFANFGLQSPATHPVPSLHGDFESQESLPIRVFLSSGDRRDNEEATRRLRDILRDRVLEFEYLEVPHAHTWENWRPLLDDAALFFFGRSTP